MERAKSPYAIYKRKPAKPRKSKSQAKRCSCEKKPRAVFYVRFRDPETSEYLTAVSSGCTNRDKAVAWAEKELAGGAYLNRSSRAPTFDDAAAGFWDFDSSPYMLSKIARGRSFSRSYAAIRAGQVKKHLSPVLGQRRLPTIRQRDIENMVMNWYKAGELAPASINRILVTAKVMFKWWAQAGVIPNDPASKVELLKEETKEREILSIPEAQRVYRARAGRPSQRRADS